MLKKMWHIKASKFIVFKMIFIFQVNDHDYIPRLYKFVGVVRSSRARLAQLVEHQTFNLRAMGSNPIPGFQVMQYISRKFTSD